MPNCIPTPLRQNFGKGALFLAETKYSASEKVEGGKLVAVEVLVSDGVITNAKITGDFFLHPEESITALEGALVGVKIPFDWIETEKKLLSVITHNQLVLVGVKSGNIISVLSKAVSEGAK